MRKLLFSLLLGGLGVLAGCGGSGSGGGGGNTPVTLVSIQVTPANPSIGLGKTQQFSATGSYSDGTTKNLTATANWLSSSATVATINVSGTATAVAPGTTTITATSGAVSGNTTLTVANPLQSITVTPGSASVAPNGTQQFTASGTFADGTMQNITSSVTWSASVGATITQAGLATGVTPGSMSTIMAAQGSVSGSATLTVTNPLVSIAVTPAAQTIHTGTSQLYTATGTFADGTTQNITSTVTWASSTPSIATISNSPGIQGTASGIAGGTTSITATLGSIVSPPASLTVSASPIASIAVTPASAALVLQAPQQYTAMATFTDNLTQDITNTATWTSSDTTKITITVSGVATGVATTSTPVTISAAQGGVTGNTTATVVAPSVVSITITPSSVKLAQGTSRQYRATAKLTNGGTLNVSSQASWTSADTTLATVGVHSGLVQAATSVANSSNPINITATFGGVTQTLPLNVTNATPTTITVSASLPTPTIPVGVPERFTATGAFNDGTTQDISLSATWSSSDTTVATVGIGGVASGLKPGSATITAMFSSVSATATLNVSTATLSTIAVTPAQTVLAPASTLGYQAVGSYSDGTTQGISNVVTWSSKNSAVATIETNTGIATGQSAGTSTISAAYQGVTSNSATVLVTSSPLVSIAVAPSPATLPATVPEGVGIQFAATGSFANGSTENLTSNVNWASTQPSIATVSDAVGGQGIATGVSPGQSSITAVFAGVVGSATLTVTNATIMSIAVLPNPATANAGSQLGFGAKGTFSDGSVISLTSQVGWSSSDVTVATINGVGTASAVKAGTTMITATFTQNGVTVSGSSSLTVH